MIQRVENYLMDRVRSGGRVRRTLALLALMVGGLLAVGVGMSAALAVISALYLFAFWIGTANLALPALVLAFIMYPFWRCWEWWSRRKRTFFEIEYTDNAGCILRTLTPEARAWAEKCLIESRLPNGDYLVGRAIVGGVIAGASERGYLVRMVPATTPTKPPSAHWKMTAPVMKRLIKRAVVLTALAYAAWVIYDHTVDPPGARLVRRCEAKVPLDVENRAARVSECVRAPFPWAR